MDAQNASRESDSSGIVNLRMRILHYVVHLLSELCYAYVMKTSPPGFAASWRFSPEIVTALPFSI